MASNSQAANFFMLSPRASEYLRRHDPAVDQNHRMRIN
jgi:hypothetical protein